MVSRGIVSPAGPVSSLEKEVTPFGGAIPVMRAVSARVVLACGSSRGHWRKSVKSTSPPVRIGSWRYTARGGSVRMAVEILQLGVMNKGFPLLVSRSPFLGEQQTAF